MAGCSSLLNISKDFSWMDKAAYYKHSWAPFCQEVLERRTIDTISVVQLAKLLPPALPIRVLKIDAQGLDLKLVQAMPESLLERVLSFQLEARLRRCRPLYEGQESCEEMTQYMASRGYVAQVACRPGCSSCRPSACEQNVLYVRRGVKLSLPQWDKNGDVGRRRRRRRRRS